MSDWLVLCLLMESALVFIGLVTGQNVQVAIVFYWLVLTIKNLVDYLERKHKHGSTL